MMRGVNQRAAIAITLMVALLFSAGTLVLPAQNGAHSCCLHMNIPRSSSKTNCCTVAPQIPPAVVTPAFPDSVSLDLTPAFLPAVIRPIAVDIVALAIIPPQSPPNGAFSLRI
jgi:hypothetical protein